MELSEAEFQRIAHYMLQHFGLNLTAKKVLMKNRLVNMVTQSPYSSFLAFFKAAKQDETGTLMTSILDRLTTNHTFFYREKEHFELLVDTVLPQFINAAGRHAERELRVWSAGCSTGEEPYTLAILLHEFFKNRPGWQFDILATDISHQVLDTAFNGIYAKSGITKLHQKFQTTYFNNFDKDRVMICDMIKRRVLFKRLNFARSNFPFRKKFHIIFCRNVMIYFTDAFKLKLIHQFYKHTELNGHLFVGHSEMLPMEGIAYHKIFPSLYIKESETN